MSTNYIVRPGDTLGKIAATHGFKDYREIYDHPANAAFKGKRPNPNLIYPGDVIVIPDKTVTPPVPMTPPLVGQRPPVTRTCELPRTSAFLSWPKELLGTLCNSYKAHSSGINRYLDNAFWASEPASFEEALSRLGPAVQTNALKWVYSRAVAIPGLWPFISFIHNLWSGDSHGFAFTCTDKVHFRAFLDRSSSISFENLAFSVKPNFCRDIPLMMSDHQAAGPTQCWREIVDGAAGLHICIPIDDSTDQSTIAGESSIHIDPHQIVKGKDEDGTCSYSADGVISHGRDVGGGVLRRKAEEILRNIEKKLE